MRRRRRTRIVVDANVWVSVLLTRSFPGLVARLEQREVLLVVADALLIELLDVLNRPKLRSRLNFAEVEAFFDQLRAMGEHVEPVSTVQVCRDPDDNAVLAVCRDGRADLLITGDADLLVL